MNMQLIEEKEAIESQCTMLKGNKQCLYSIIYWILEENGRLKELITLKELETNSLDQIVEENNKLKVQQDRLRRGKMKHRKPKIYLYFFQILSWRKKRYVKK